MSLPLATSAMASQYNTWTVAVSFVIAALASFVALDLARRVRDARGRASAAWWLAGSLAMGSGIWSMHFIGMQAFQLPIALGYTGGLTLLSWISAVVASGVVLGLASQGSYRPGHLWLGALAMGGGISTMHYLGMAALDLTLPILWNWTVVAASIAMAVGASAAALLIFQAMRRVPPGRQLPYRSAAALVMGAAICGMHYTGMAAASFQVGTVCLSAGQLGGPSLTAMVTIGSGTLLISTLLTALLDGRLPGAAQRLMQSLQERNAELQSANDALQQRAYADALTGLPNRLLFEDRLGHALLRLDRANSQHCTGRLAVLFIDLDGFKPVNDSFGHAAGDLLLTVAADRMRELARECDTVARLGGDEFLVLLEDIASTADAEAFAQRMLQALAQPIVVEGREVSIACSIGIAIHPGHGDRSKLVSQADAAMYAAKRAGGRRYVLFEPGHL